MLYSVSAKASNFLTGFYCFNSWLNCIDGFNNEFQIIIKNINDEIVETNNYKFNDGNPNVNDVKSFLSGSLINKVLVSYDKQRRSQKMKNKLNDMKIKKSRLIYIIMSRYSKTKEKYLLTFYGIHDENAPDVLFSITNQGTANYTSVPT
jgi:hypothetical protein